MNKLVILGVGGFGREVAWLVERINAMNPTWALMGFIDDNPQTHDKVVNGYRVLGGRDWLAHNGGEVYVACAIGSSKTRKRLISELKHARFATLVDPKVEISERVSMGEGCIICAGTILTVDITIGSHVIINLYCTIGHDATINDYVTINPSVNVSGHTYLGECVEMGTGSQIIQGIRVGDGTIVGAGAVVVKELPGECTAVGAPAKPIKFHTR
jgi:sugar O-acyltransferase (sialic acid O-acetyltransferase NeuD family)